MGALTVRFPESLHEKVRALADQEGISMNQFAVLAVSEKVARLDAEDQMSYLRAVEQVGEALAAREGQSLSEAARSVLDRAAASEEDAAPTEAGNAEVPVTERSKERPAEDSSVSPKRSSSSRRGHRGTAPKARDRTVYHREDGQWANKRDGASQPSSVHETQAAAQDAARGMLRNQGGGELSTQGTDGQIRDKDSVSPGSDPESTEG